MSSVIITISRQNNFGIFKQCHVTDALFYSPADMQDDVFSCFILSCVSFKFYLFFLTFILKDSEKVLVLSHMCVYIYTYVSMYV